MHRRTLTSLIALTLLAAAEQVSAQGTAFTYSGRLSDGGRPANGLYDIRVGLYSNSAGGTIVAGPLISSGVPISNGLFTITLDYGSVFDDTPYWLQISARTNGATAFTGLSPRQQLTPTPYAIFAEGANAAGLSGTIPSTTLSGTYGSAVSFTNPANILAGDGSQLTGVNATTLGGLASSNFWATIGNAGTSPTNGNFLGTTDDQPLELRVNGSRAFRLEPIANSTVISNMVNVVGGSPINFVTPGYVGATIAGGGSSHYIGLTSLGNSVGGDFGSIGGGGGNNVSATFGTVAGGKGNFAGGFNGSTVGGGENNKVTGPYAVVAGGFNNSASGSLFGGYSTVAGGAANTASGDYATVSGGSANTASGVYASLAGGNTNIAGGDYATVAGGTNNSATGLSSTVAGGADNSAASRYTTVGGGHGNIAVDADATVAGGYFNMASNSDSTVGGGANNIADANYALVGGGQFNTAESHHGTVGGGWGNEAGGAYSTVAGGYENSMFGTEATIGGGHQNASDGEASTVAGGYHNLASGTNAFIGGGYYNEADGQDSAVGGGHFNTASGSQATVPGGWGNTAAGTYSFAAGFLAQATHNGSFVWADANAAPPPYSNFVSTTHNQFRVRCTGGAMFVTAIDSVGNDTAGVKVAAGGTSWSAICDRNAKKNFQPLDTVAVLDKLATIPIEQWNYRWEANNDTPNLGPMAQDFKAAFYPGRDDKSISTLEFDGVELAAIQGLNHKLEERARTFESQLQRKDVEIQQLQKTVNELKEIVSQLAAKKGEQ